MEKKIAPSIAYNLSDDVILLYHFGNFCFIFHIEYNVCGSCWLFGYPWLGADCKCLVLNKDTDGLYKQVSHKCKRNKCIPHKKCKHILRRISLAYLHWKKYLKYFKEYATN